LLRAGAVSSEPLTPGEVKRAAPGPK
jgi:hypothetical protein